MRSSGGGTQGRLRLTREVILVGASLTIALILVLQAPKGTPDLFTEWLVIHGVTDGVDVSTPIRDLADVYGFEDHFIHDSVPRAAIDPGTPGGLLFDLPLLLVSSDELRHVSFVLFLVASMGFALAISRLIDRPFYQVALFIPVLMLTHPWRDHVALGQSTLLVGALIAWTWLLARKGDELTFGVPLGIAVTLKLFPWFLIPVLWMTGRIRTALGAVTVFVALNLVGLTLPGVRRGSIPAWLSDDGSWFTSSPFNGSPSLLLGTPMWVLPFVALLTLPWFRRMDLDRALAIAIPVSLIVSPLLWMHYVTILPLAIAGTWGLGLLVGIGLLTLNPPLHAFLGTVTVWAFLLLWRQAPSKWTHSSILCPVEERGDRAHEHVFD